MKRSHVIVVGSSVFFSGWAVAHPPFEPLGVLPGYTSSVALGGDLVFPGVVGQCLGGPPEAPARAFIWFPEQGMLPIPVSATVEPIAARAMSANTCVGVGVDGGGFIRVGGIAGPTALPTGGFSGTVDPMALAYVGGSIVAGALHLSGGQDRAFRWTESEGYFLIPPLVTGETTGAASAISFSGSTIVGRMTRPGLAGGQAFVWTSAGTVGLGWFSGTGIPDSAATSTDGTTTVGYSTGGALAVGAFKYSVATGMVELGTLPGAIESRACSIWYGTGRIAGYCTYPDGHTAPVLWDKWLGIVDLRNAVISAGGVIPPGWSLDRAVATGDGGTVGNGRDASGNQVAFIMRPRLCFANCDQSSAAPVLNVSDFTCFLNRFAAREDYANCDHSTAPPVLNVLDFVCFLNKFAAGCSVS